MAQDGHDDQQGTPFPLTIGSAEDADFDVNAAEGGEGDDGAPDLAAQVAELQQQLRDNEVRWAAQREFLQNGIKDLSATRQQQSAPKAPELNLDDLPDPVEKPAEFKAALAQRHTEYTQNLLRYQQEQQSAQTASEQSQVEKLNGLNTRFAEKYSDLAPKTALLQGATAFEANELRRAGITDVMGHIFADPDKFLDRVADRMRAELGAQPNGAQQQQQRPANRTKGVSSGTRAQTGGQQPQKPMGFLEQLRKQQHDTGLI